MSVHPDRIIEAERIGFMFGRGGFPKESPPHEYSQEECAAWFKGWEFSKVKSLHGMSIAQIHEFVDAAFNSGNSDFHGPIVIDPYASGDWFTIP